MHRVEKANRSDSTSSFSFRLLGLIGLRPAHDRHLRSLHHGISVRLQILYILLRARQACWHQNTDAAMHDAFTCRSNAPTYIGDSRSPSLKHVWLAHWCSIEVTCVFFKYITLLLVFSTKSSDVSLRISCLYWSRRVGDPPPLCGTM